jgi:hypothetical protein
MSDTILVTLSKLNHREMIAKLDELEAHRRLVTALIRAVPQERAGASRTTPRKAPRKAAGAVAA